MKVCIIILAFVAAAPLRAQTADAPRTSRADGDSLVAVRLHHPSLHDPRAIAVDPFGSIYIVDAGRGAVLKLSATGALEATLGGPGSREGEFDDPADVDPTNGMVILVADAGNRRIQRFSRSFAYLGSIPLTGTNERRTSAPARITYHQREADVDPNASGRPISIASSAANELFAIDADRNVVVKLDEDRRVVKLIGDIDAGAGGLSTPVALGASDELLYVADVQGGVIVVYDLFGTYVKSLGAGRLADVRAVALDRNAVYAALPFEIAVFSSSGLEHIIAVNVPEEIRDLAVGADGRILVLTSEGLYQLRSSS